MLGLSDLALYSSQVYMGVWGGLTLSSQQRVRDRGKTEERFVPQIPEVSTLISMVSCAQYMKGCAPQIGDCWWTNGCNRNWGLHTGTTDRTHSTTISTQFLICVLTDEAALSCPQPLLPTSNFNIPSSLLKYVGNSGIPECPADYLPSALQQGHA